MKATRPPLHLHTQPRPSSNPGSSRPLTQRAPRHTERRPAVKLLLAVAASAAVAGSAGALLHTSGASSKPSARGLLGSSVGSASHHTALLAWTTTPAIAGCFHRDGSGRSSGMSFGARCSSVFGRLIAIGKNLGIGRGAGDTSGAGLAVKRRSHRRDACVGVGHGLRMMVGSAEKQERQRMRAMVREFEGRLAVCAKSGDSEGGKSIFREMKDENLPLSKNAWSMMLKLCHDGRESGLALEIYDEMKSQGVEPAESTYSQLVRTCADDGQMDRAAELVEECRAKGLPVRLRTYQPLIAHHLNKGELRLAFSWWDEMLLADPNILTSSTNSHQGPVEHIIVHMLTACANALARGGGGGDGSDEEWIVGKMDLVLGQMSQVCMCATEESAERLSKAFGESRSGVVVPGEDGLCPRTGARLRSIALTEEERCRVLEGLKDYAVASGGPVHGKLLAQWGEWLVENSEPFTVVVDAPNVAYARQNFEGGGFSFHQIDLCVSALKERGERVMVLLPHKYLQAKIPNHAKFSGEAAAKGGPVAQHEVTLEEQSIIDNWEHERMLCSSPQGANDDWYWMYASVLPSEKLLRVVSNDQMRDHRLSLLEPRPFLRWKATQICRFELSHAFESSKVADGSLELPTMRLMDPPNFSSEIQRNNADEGSGGPVWHIPIGGDGQSDAPHTVAAMASTTKPPGGWWFDGGDKRPKQWLYLRL